MAARLLFVGDDICHRLPVLLSAGYTVAELQSPAQLTAALAALDCPDAILVTSTDAKLASQVLSVARSRSTTPVILFCDQGYDYGSAQFDLVIPVLTPPLTWLEDIRALVEKNRERSAD